MANAASRINLALTLIFAISLACLGFAAFSSGVLGSLFTLHRGAPGDSLPQPARQLVSTSRAVTGYAPMTSPVETVTELPIIPVAGVNSGQLVDTYTEARDRGQRRHDAIDILAPQGTAVLAAAPGTVEKLYTSAQGGITLYLRSRDRLMIYYYAHLDGYSPGLHEGQAVRQGEVIGRVGFTGNAEPAAPHLHFAVWRVASGAQWHQDHVAINPYPLLHGS
jgi:murein DD-endopeptidase MepM/ murein hydrolase activator NlpD